jgi:hypothetical protein
VLIAPAHVQSALQPRSGADGELLTFADTDALRALETILDRRPRLITLERLFAATPRGAALINRIKSDPTLTDTEIRVVAHDSDYMRIARPGTAPAEVPAPKAAPPEPAVVNPEVAAAAALDSGFDEFGTRRAPRFQIRDNVPVMLDGNRAVLIDMSQVGAQVVSPAILKPNQRVRVGIVDQGMAVRFNAVVVWASFEIPPNTAPRYRAGLEFVDAAPAAVDAFCARHQRS